MKFIRLILFACTFFASTTLFGNETQKQEYFSILTCSPAEEIYARFGHTAIRYVNTEEQIDIVYNYGIFSFTDNFVWNFTGGQTYYMLGVQRFSRFVDSYIEENRAIYEQKLNLSLQQTFELRRLLETNYLPKNREYLYNFFYDNCSSRPRDLLIKVIGDNLNWNYEQPIVIPNNYWYKNEISKVLQNPNYTWRNVMNIFHIPHTWLDFGINVGLGLPTDKVMSRYNSMFLPDFLMFNIDRAEITENNETRPLASEPTLVINPTITKTNIPYYESPLFIIWAISIVFITIAFFGYKKQRHFYWLDSILYLLLGIFGVVVWRICIFSIHPGVFPNFNIIWASPLHILFAILWLIPKLRKKLQVYLYLYTAIFILYIISAPINPQYVHAAYIPLLLLFASRGFTKDLIKTICLKCHSRNLS